MKMNPSFAEHIMLYLEQKSYDHLARKKQRLRYREACNQIFQVRGTAESTHVFWLGVGSRINGIKHLV